MVSPYLGIKTVEHLCLRLGLDLGQLMRLCKTAERSYVEFERPKKSGGKKRKLSVPRKNLKDAQKRVYCRLLKHFPFSKEMHGGISGCSIRSNAKKHCNKKYLINIDIRDFFPAIKKKRIFNLFSTHLGCSSAVSKILTKLVTHKGVLPQGSSTSCAVANLIMHFEILPKINQVLPAEPCFVTTYIDDISISSNSKDIFKAYSKIVEAIKSLGFSTHPFNTPGKNEILYSSSKMKVNGIIVNLKPNLEKSWSKRLRSRIHHFLEDRKLMSSVEVLKERRSILGQIAFSSNVNPNKGSKFKSMMSIDTNS